MDEDEYVQHLSKRQIRAVQMWMALDLHMALGYHYDPNSEYQGFKSWADWWANLCADVRMVVLDQDLELDN